MTVTLRPMPDSHFDAWIARGNAEYLAERMRAGESREVAEAKAAQSFAENFPENRPLASHRVFDVVADDDVVGVLWIGPQREAIDQWWVYEIEIFEPHRRRGHARAALELGHDEAKALGATAIGLNVFGFNTGARELYEKLGYEITAVQMLRTL